MRQSMRFSAAGLGLLAGLVSVLAFRDIQAEQPQAKLAASTASVVEKSAVQKPADQQPAAQQHLRSNRLRDRSRIESQHNPGNTIRRQRR